MASNPSKPASEFSELNHLVRFVVPYLWPKNEPGLRRRVVIASVLMIAGESSSTSRSRSS